jgi:hypothetical protein
MRCTNEIFVNSDQNPCHCKVIGPTIGFIVTVGMAVGLVLPARDHLLMYLRSSAGPHRFSAAVARLIRERGKPTVHICELGTDHNSVLALPVDTGNSISNAIPI